MQSDKAKQFFGFTKKTEVKKEPELAGETSAKVDNTWNAGEDVEQDEIEEILDEELQTNEGSETKSKEEQQVISDDKVITAPAIFPVNVSGRMLLYGCDAFFPRAIIGVGKYVGYKTDKKATDLMLTEKEVAILEPLADPVAKELFQHMSPMAQFVTAISMMYMQKL